MKAIAALNLSIHPQIHTYKCLVTTTMIQVFYQTLEIQR